MPRIDWSPVGRRIVVETKKAVATFRRAHGDEVVCAVAIDATPSEDFFAVCFDTAARPHALVGEFTHHLFHEFEAGVDAQRPEDGWPAAPRGSRDGFVEAALRRVLTRELRGLADAGALDALATTSTLRVGYCYHDSAFVPCRTRKRPASKRRAPTRKPRAQPSKPAAKAGSGLPWLLNTPLADEFLDADPATAFDRATPYFEGARAGVDQDEDSARWILFRVTAPGRAVDPRWEARAAPLVADLGLGNAAVGLLEMVATPSARATLAAAFEREPSSRLADALARLGDRRVAPFLVSLLDDKRWRYAGHTAESLAALGDPSAVPALERWLAAPRNRRDPSRIAIERALAALRK